MIEGDMFATLFPDARILRKELVGDEQSPNAAAQMLIHFPHIGRIDLVRRLGGVLVRSRKPKLAKKS